MNDFLLIRHGINQVKGFNPSLKLKNNNARYSFKHDSNYDMFTFGGKDCDFQVKEEFHLVSDNFVSLLKKHGQVEDSPKKKVMETADKLPFYIVSNRTDPKDVRIFAGQYVNEKGVLAKGPTFVNGTKPDALYSSKGAMLILYKPNQGWMEVSVLGSCYTIRKRENEKGDSKDADNILVDGCLIYAGGILFKYSSNPTTTLNELKEKIDSTITYCSQTGESFDMESCGDSIRRVKGNKALLETQARFFKQKNPKVYYNRNYTSDDTPYVADACGHVSSIQVALGESVITLKWAKVCHVCDKERKLIPLTIKSNPEIISDVPEYLLLPCAHTLDKEGVDLWCGGVDMKNKTGKGIKVPIKSMKTISRGILYDDQIMNYCCPYCRLKVEKVQKIFYP